MQAGQPLKDPKVRIDDLIELLIYLEVTELYFFLIV